MKLALLSNVNVDSLARRLRRAHEVHVAAGFGSWVQELVQPDSATFQFKPDVLLLLLDAGELTLSLIHI